MHAGSGASASKPAALMMLAVVPKVAPLAHCLEVHWITVLGLVIEVCDSENDSTVGELGVSVILFPAAPTEMQSAFALAFAKAMCSCQNRLANLSPVAGVSRFVFWMNRHGQPILIL